MMRCAPGLPNARQCTRKSNKESNWDSGLQVIRLNRERRTRNTGWERKRGTPAYLDANPGLTAAAGRTLVGWGAALVGIDAPNIDVAGDTGYGAHHALLSAGVPVIENVANVARVGSSPFMLAAFPLRLRGASGSPVRLVALVP